MRIRKRLKHARTSVWFVFIVTVGKRERERKIPSVFGFCITCPYLCRGGCRSDSMCFIFPMPKRLAPQSIGEFK